MICLFVGKECLKFKGAKSEVEIGKTNMYFCVFLSMVGRNMGGFTIFWERKVMENDMSFNDDCT